MDLHRRNRLRRNPRLRLHPLDRLCSTSYDATVSSEANHPAPADTPPPVLSAVVVHWRNESEVQDLVSSWPDDPRLQLIVVDNSGSAAGPHVDPHLDSSGQAAADRIRWIVPEGNLGFGGGANCGVEQATGEWVLILNPDIIAQPESWENLLKACERYPDAAGLAPALVHADGRSQCSWQLQPLPSPFTLILQTLFLGGRRGPRKEPAEGTPIEQPAAAALALRRSIFLAHDGFDERFFPAWFEDVDLAKRLADAGEILRYVPSARFVHATGGSVPALGYGPFLWIYYRNLEIYLRRHHGDGWIWLTRLTLPFAMTVRLLALPLRRPRRAKSVKGAVLGLLSVLFGCLSGWRRPKLWARRFHRAPSQRGHLRSSNPECSSPGSPNPGSPNPKPSNQKSPSPPWPESTP